MNNLTTVTQGVQTRNFVYDNLARLKQATNPEAGTINYTYDNNGNLTSKTDARSITTSYVYDNLNRVKTRSYSDNITPQVSYFYDNLTNAKGKLIKVENAYSKTEYQSFDILGRVTQSQQTTDGNVYNPMTYTYNLSGALIEETYPSGRVVKNTLDADGDLSQVQSKKANDTFRNYANSFNYTAAGAVSSMRLGNGRWENMQFNSRLQPTQIGLGTSATNQSLLKLDYEYGELNLGTGQVIAGTNNGNIAKQTITVQNVGSNQGFSATQYYAYDSLNRIKIASENLTPNGGTMYNSWKQTFTYDRYGNRRFDQANTTFPTFSNPNITNPQIDTANNRFTSGQGYTYDLNGNLLTDAEGKSFVYDAENKQKSVSNTSSTIGQYFYDGDGKRVKKIVPSTGETTIFIYDASGKMVAEYSTIVEPVATAKVSYLTNDHLGSPRIITNETGVVTSRRDFMPFGEEISSAQRTSGLNYTADNIREKFATYERDSETNLDFAQARMFVYNQGRFTSPDPTLLSVNAYNPQSWNRYVYVLNNPLLYIDPLGLWELSTTTIHKTDKDGNDVLDDDGNRIVDRIEVTARKTSDKDTAASLAKQLGLTGKDAEKFAGKIGEGDNIRLSEQGGLVGRVFDAVEDGLTAQNKWEVKNKDKLAELAAKKIYGPNNNDCSGTSCRIGLGDNTPLIGTNVLDPRLDTEARNVAESDAQVGDIIRYAKSDNVATHFANFIFRDDDGTPVAFSKSGTNGRYENKEAGRLQTDLYGTIRGRNKDSSGYYRRR